MYVAYQGRCMSLTFPRHFILSTSLSSPYTYPISGVGSRQIRHFELSLIRYDLQHISTYILTFHAYLMPIVSKLARILRERNGDQHLPLYSTPHSTGKRRPGPWSVYPPQPRRVSDGFQRGQQVCSFLSRDRKSVV